MSSPVITSTWSSLRMCMALISFSRLGRGSESAAGSDHLGGQADDLHELAVAELAGDGAEDAGAAGVLLVVDQDDGVAVELDVGAVGAAGRVADADDDAADDVAGLDVAAGARPS